MFIHGLASELGAFHWARQEQPAESAWACHRIRWWLELQKHLKGSENIQQGRWEEEEREGKQEKEEQLTDERKEVTDVRCCYCYYFHTLPPVCCLQQQKDALHRAQKIMLKRLCIEMV